MSSSSRERRPAAQWTSGIGEALRTASNHSSFWPAVALVLLLVACGLRSPGFLSISLQDGHLFGQLVDTARNSVTPLLLALGMCLVIATAGIDLSVGAVMAISLAVSLTYLEGSADAASPASVLTAVLLGLAVALAIGIFNGFLVSVLDIQPFIATMILMVAGRGIAMLLTQGQITTVTSAPFKSIGSGFLFGIPMPIIIAIVVFALMVVLVRRTAFGMMVEAVGINREAARLSGVRARSTTWIVYIVCGLLAGLAGIVYGAPTMAADANNIGLMKEMDAIMVVVLGGTKLSGGRFSLGGTVVGALILATLERAVIIFHLPSQTTPLFKAIVLVIVCVAASPIFRERMRLRRARREAVRSSAVPVDSAASAA